MTFVDTAEQFYPRDHDRRRREPFETEHRTDAKFHATVILFDQVVQIFRRPNLYVRWQLTAGLHLTHGAMRRRVSVQCDGSWGRSLSLDGLAEKRLGRADVALSAQAEIHGLTGAIHRPV